MKSLVIRHAFCNLVFWVRIRKVPRQTLEFVYGADFMRILHHLSTPTRWDGVAGLSLAEDRPKPPENKVIVFLGGLVATNVGVKRELQPGVLRQHLLLGVVPPPRAPSSLLGGSRSSDRRAVAANQITPRGVSGTAAPNRGSWGGWAGEASPKGSGIGARFFSTLRS